MDEEDYKHDFMERFGKCSEDMPDFKAYQKAYNQVIPQMKRAGYKGDKLRKFIDECKEATGVI